MGVKGTRNKKKGKLNFTHRDLCFDLAEAKGTRFIEFPLGSVWLNRREGPGQADVITIKPSYNRFNTDIYEVKVTRGDLLQDIKKNANMRSICPIVTVYILLLSRVFVIRKKFPKE